MKVPLLCYFPKGYDRECSKNELRMFISFGEGICSNEGLLHFSRRDKSKNTLTTIKIFRSILWWRGFKFVQMKWEIATFNQSACIIIALLKLVYWLLRAVSLVSNVAHGPLVFSLIIFTLITGTRSEYFINKLIFTDSRINEASSHAKALALLLVGKCTWAIQSQW